MSLQASLLVLAICTPQIAMKTKFMFSEEVMVATTSMICMNSTQPHAIGEVSRISVGCNHLHELITAQVLSRTTFTFLEVGMAQNV
jgi:hypothetical protein